MELKPCPFCGKNIVDVEGENVWCGNCHVYLHNADRDNPFSIDELWQKRPIEDKLQTKIKELEMRLIRQSNIITTLWQKHAEDMPKDGPLD